MTEQIPPEVTAIARTAKAAADRAHLLREVRDDAIRVALASGFTQQQVANAAGISTSAVRNIAGSAPDATPRQSTAPDPAEKVRENRLRREAKRQGMVLRKSRVKHQQAIDYGTFGLFDLATNSLVVGTSNGFGMSLDDIEAALAEGQQ